MGNDIEVIQEKILEMGLAIGAKRSLLVVHSKPIGDGTPYVSLGDGFYSLVYSERGEEFCRQNADTLDDLLYYLMDNIISKMAREYERCHRVEGEDFRRLYFFRKMELMSKLSPAWGYRLQHEIDKILLDAPFRDK